MIVSIPGCAGQAAVKLGANRTVVRSVTEAANNRDYDLLDELLTPDFIRHSQATAEAQIGNREEELSNASCGS